MATCRSRGLTTESSARSVALRPCRSRAPGNRLWSRCASSRVAGRERFDLDYVSTEVADQNRDSVRTLAFQARDQSCAWWPDSTATAFDKQNVRDGHYHMWSYTHWLLQLDKDGKPRNPDAQRVIDLLVGNPTSPAPAFEPIDAVVKAGLIPQCAMRVQRSREGGDFTRYVPPLPCGCYFDKLQSTQGSRCMSCADSSTCGGGVCRHGFCEAS